MLTSFQWTAVICILAVTFAGGFLPLFQSQRARLRGAYPSGEAFTSGIFLALSLLMMLPSGLHLLQKAYPKFAFPLASLIAAVAFVLLLAIEQTIRYLRAKAKTQKTDLEPPTFPIIMTVMIAVPSFFLGTALGVSEFPAAAMILIAILVHKGSAAFSLALKMVRSTLTHKQTLIIFTLFACSTPFGILVGEEVHQYLGSHTMVIVRGVILSLASGTFLYLGTVHDLKHSPFIEHCSNKKGYLLMLLGFILTVIVRYLIGAAHSG